jgi:hypothetical protein
VFLPVSRLSDPLPDWLMIGADATTEEAFYYQVKWRIADFLAPTFISQYVCQGGLILYKNYIDIC